MSSTRYSSYSSLKGIGGWLLFLCIALTVLTPFGLLAELSSAIDLSAQLKNSYPRFSSVVFLAALPKLLLVIFSFYAGVSLWRVKQHAVVKAQWFLISYAAFSLLHIMTAFLGDLPADIRQNVVNAYGIGALRVLAFSVVWHQYLRRSERVANTYSP